MPTRRRPAAIHLYLIGLLGARSALGASAPNVDRAPNTLLDCVSAVDDEAGAGGKWGLVGGEVEDRVGDIVGAAEPLDQVVALHLLDQLDVLRHLDVHVRIGEAGADGVHPDIMRG